MDPVKLKLLWRSQNIMMEVLQDRGYVVDDDRKLSFEKFKAWAGEDEEEAIKEAILLKVTKSISSIKKETTFVIWPVEEKLGDNIQFVLQKMGLDGAKTDTAQVWT